MADSNAMPEGSELQNGRYVIAGTIGEGGFGITYRAHDNNLQRTVAIKELYPNGSSRQGNTITLPLDYTQPRWDKMVADFVREARILARLEHPAIVTVHDHFAANNTAYMVMRYIDGITLLQRAQQQGGRLPEAEVVRYAVAVGEALSMIHAHGLLHRDIKPSNIMLNRAGQAVLVDFGSAREFVSDQALTQTVMVSYGFAPPEQFHPKAPRGPFMDIYSLAATCYFLITGHAANFDTQPSSELSPTVLTALEHGMTFNPHDRPQDMATFLTELTAGSPSPAASPNPPPERAAPHTPPYGYATSLPLQAPTPAVTALPTAAAAPATLADRSPVFAAETVPNTPTLPPLLPPPAAPVAAVPPPSRRWLTLVAGLLVLLLLAALAFLLLGNRNGNDGNNVAAIAVTATSTASAATATLTPPLVAIVVSATPHPSTVTPLPPTSTPLPSATPPPSDTSLPPTAPPAMPTDTPTSTPSDTPTNVAVPASDTPLPPADTPIPLPTRTPKPSATSRPSNTPRPTNTPHPATSTPLPSNTPLPPPTNTPVPSNTPPPPPTSTPVPSGCNKQGRPVQGFDVDGEFYYFWCVNGGGKVFGYPIAAVVNDASRYTGVSRYQWFSKARLEWHPSYGSNGAAALGAVGVEDSRVRGYTQESKSFKWTDPDPQKRYFAETHHNVGGSFALHFNAFGGADVFGYPISEEFVESGTTVQYFQRAVFELNPQNGATILRDVGYELTR